VRVKLRQFLKRTILTYDQDTIKSCRQSCYDRSICIMYIERQHASHVETDYLSRSKTYTECLQNAYIAAAWPSS